MSVLLPSCGAWELMSEFLCVMSTHWKVLRSILSPSCLVVPENWCLNSCTYDVDSLEGSDVHSFAILSSCAWELMSFCTYDVNTQGSDVRPFKLKHMMWTCKKAAMSILLCVWCEHARSYCYLFSCQSCVYRMGFLFLSLCLWLCWIGCSFVVIFSLALACLCHVLFSFCSFSCLQLRRLVSFCGGERSSAIHICSLHNSFELCWIFTLAGPLIPSMVLSEIR